ncbi:MAG: alkaline phosphatase [Panacagrimonas sp.]
MSTPRLAFATVLSFAVLNLPGCKTGLTVEDVKHPHGETADWWYRSGAVVAHQQRAGAGSAKNLILFIGDGMGLTTVSAARIFAGQLKGAPGEEHLLSFEDFGHTALSKTYNTNLQTPDSAGTITAMASGIKTRAGVIGIDSVPARGDCAASRVAHVPTLIELAEDAGLATGIVTTARLTHATPAGLYAHTPDRNWESDADLPSTAQAAGCSDIASQLVGFAHGDGIDVLLGGGRQNFLPRTLQDPEYPNGNGRRADGRSLVAEWEARFRTGRYVWNRTQFENLDANAAGPILGLFEPGHMRYEHDRPGDAAGEPSLADMTRLALRKLAQSSAKGYVLMVEAGRIDHAHHAGNAYRALVDTVALDEAVRAAMELTSTDDTLILVTADHSHTLSFSGYPVRGNPILGKVIGLANEGDGEPTEIHDSLSLPTTTLNYTNGPGYAGASDAQPEGPKHFPHSPRSAMASTGRPDLSQVDTTQPDYLQESISPRDSETHGGEDVPVYACGPGSGAVRGVIEQNVIFHLLAQAQPAIRRLLCDRGACEQGAPVKRVRSIDPKPSRTP